MFIFDAHCDSLSCEASNNSPLAQRNPSRQWDFAAIKDSNWLQVMAVFIDKAKRSEITLTDFLLLYKRLQQELAQNPQIKWLKTADDLRKFDEHSQGIILGLEGAEALEAKAENINYLYDLGVRVLGLAWNNDNAFAGGTYGSREGLTDLGKRAVKMVNDLPLILDGAHLCDKSLADLLRLSQKPIIVSHANSRHLCPHLRNLSDEILREIAKNGGVVGVTYVKDFLKPDKNEANIVSVAEHIMHMVEIMGIEHVGLGSDFDGIDEPLPGLERAEKTISLRPYLKALGFTAEDMALIMGENFKRVMLEVL